MWTCMTEHDKGRRAVLRRFRGHNHGLRTTLYPSPSHPAIRRNDGVKGHRSHSIHTQTYAHIKGQLTWSAAG
jgi:hypothetical protein